MQREVGEEQHISGLERRHGTGEHRWRLLRQRSRKKSTLADVAQKAEAVRARCNTYTTIGNVHWNEWRPDGKQSLSRLLFEEILHAEEGVVLMPRKARAGRRGQLCAAVEALGEEGFLTCKGFDE